MNPDSHSGWYRKWGQVTANGGPPAYLLFIEGATHSSYAGKRTSGLLGERPTTDVSKIQDAVASGTTLFLDAHLRRSEEAAKVLSGDEMKRSIPGKVEFGAK